MRRTFGIVCAASICASVAAQENVLVLSSGHQPTDDAVIAAIQAVGNNATLGPEYHQFLGAGLQGVSVVYFQANWNWTFPEMPAQGQASLIDYVCKGGGLVTSEWLIWRYGTGSFAALGAVFPAMANTNFTGTATATYTQSAVDPVINAGLPAQFTFPVDSYSGTETLLLPKPGAISFYETSSLPSFPGASGVIGWDYGAGRVVNISTTCGPNQVADPNFATLLGNLMTWAGDLSPGGMLPCTPDCDKSGSLDFFDFLCFQNQFNQGAAAADCDCNQTFDFFDFLCFQNLFNAGC